MVASRASDSHEISVRRAVLTYLVTSALLAAAWHARFAYGLWVVNAVAAVAGIVLARSAMGSRWRVYCGASAKNAALGIALGIGLAAVTEVSARLLLPWMPAVRHETQRLYAVLRESLAAHQYAPIVATVAAAEELVYRGVVTARCERHSNSQWSVVATSTALYALPLAASGSWLLVAMGLTLGATLTIAQLRTQSLLVPFLAHVIWAEAVFVVVTVG